MLRSSIDLGTNTCLLLIAECDASGAVTHTMGDYSTIVRLGQGVDRARELHPEAMERTLLCLAGYAEKVRAAGANPADTAAVATSQARDASNGAEFFARVEKETGFRFRVITGEDEARFTFLGALRPSMDPRTTAVIDIGGGSTEFIADGKGLSIDVGSVRFTERFLKSQPVTDAEFWNCQAAIDEALKPVLAWRERNRAISSYVAVAGTATTLAQWHLDLAKFDAAKIDSSALSRGDVHRQVEELKWRTVEERCSLPGVDRGRADVLLAGALILWRSMELLGFGEVRVSTRGLRFGVLRAQGA